MTELTIQAKRCGVCREIKSLTDFHRNRTARDGLQGTCKPCAIQRANISATHRYQRLKHDPAFRRANRDRRLRTTYGITHDERDAMVVAQGGRCALCRKPTERLVIDHDHRTGKVRALLCDQCNVALAMTSENPDLLRAAAAYLEFHREG